jgi:uncharacterized membrane protein
LLIGLVLVFFAAPWGWEHKSHAILHGLCAQTPSHTLRFGPHGLPFDSRMTGIYGGFASTLIYLLARGRHRSAKTPSVPLMGMLALFVIAMGIDGFNSLLRDLGNPHPYMPDNRLRLVTGIGAGMAIAIVVCFLFAVALWKGPDVSRAVTSVRELPLLLAAQGPFALAAISGFSVLALPLALVLIAAAFAAVTSIVLVSIVLFRQTDNSFRSFAELDGLTSMSVLIALVVIACLAGGRFLLEHWLGLQPLP